MNALDAPLPTRRPARAAVAPSQPQATALRAIALFSMLAIGLAFSAMAAPPPATAASAPQAKASAPLTKGELKAQKEFQMLDFNGDGKLSRSEVALFPRLANAFDDADTNHDGFVSYDEVQAFAVKYRAERDRARAEAAKNPASAAKP